jgi:hypothetical protein
MALLPEVPVRNAKPRERAYKLFDERGPFLLVTPPGGRLWRLRYRIGNREKLIPLGIYPDVPLKHAREKRDEARRLIADEIDPSTERKARRAAMLVTFEGVAQEWLQLQSKPLSEETISILGARLNSGMYPYLGSRPIGSVTAVELLAAGSEAVHNHGILLLINRRQATIKQVGGKPVRGVDRVAHAIQKSMRGSGKIGGRIVKGEVLTMKLWV